MACVLDVDDRLVSGTATGLGAHHGVLFSVQKIFVDGPVHPPLRVWFLLETLHLVNEVMCHETEVHYL